MPPLDAAKLLELAPDATPEQIETRFVERRARLEDKIAKAPTPGLKEKYRVSLAQLTEAFETLTLAADGSSLPVLRRESPPPPVPAAPAAPPPAVVPGPLPAPQPSFLRNLSVFIRAGTLSAFVMLGCGLALGFVANALGLAGSSGWAVGIFGAVIVIGLLVFWLRHRRLMRLTLERLAREQAAAAADPAVRRKQAEAREFRRVLTAVVALLIVGGIWILYSRIEKSLAEQAAADRTAEETLAKRSAEESRQNAAATEKTEKERRDKLIVQLRTRMAELNVTYEAAMKIESNSDRTLSDLKSQERDLARDSKTAKSAAAVDAANKVKAQELYVAWLDRYLPTNPAKIAKARADELISSQAADDAATAVEDYAEEIKRLQSELKSNVADPVAAGMLDAIRQSAAQGDVQNMRWLGRTFLFGGKLPKDPAEGITWLKRAAEAGGDKDDLYWMGRASREGLGMARDPAAAVEWFKQAAAAGNDSAMGELADIYEKGDGVPVDAAQSLAWRKQLADKGSYFQLAYFLSNGPKTTQDPAAAIEWYKKSAEKGDAVAMHNLGAMYDNGQGTTRDPVASAAWYRKSADKGYASSMTRLGEFYLSGSGVAKDETTGLDWLKQAARLKDERAQVLLRNRNLTW